MSTLPPLDPHDRSRPRPGEWLAESFTLFGREWATWVGQGAILIFLGFAPLLLGMVVYAVLMGSLFLALLSGKSVGGGPVPPGEIAGICALAGGLLLSPFLASYLLAGMERTAARQLRGEPISVRDIFSAKDVYGSALVVSFLTPLAFSLGACCFLVPGFILGGLLSFAFPLVTEQRLGGIEAMRRSWRATVPHLWLYLLWFLLLYLLQVAGSVLLLIGSVVVIPIHALASMVAYRDVFGLEGAERRSPLSP